MSKWLKFSFHVKNILGNKSHQLDEISFHFILLFFKITIACLDTKAFMMINLAVYSIISF